MKGLIVHHDMDALLRRMAEMEQAWRTRSLPVVRLDGGDFCAFKSGRDYFDLLAERCHFSPELAERSLVLVDNADRAHERNPVVIEWILTQSFIELGSAFRLNTGKMVIVGCMIAKQNGQIGFGNCGRLPVDEEGLRRLYPGWERITVLHTDGTVA